MAWLVVDKDGTEMIFESKPSRGEKYWIGRGKCNFIKLSSGTAIKINGGRKLSWTDEPVKC